VRQHVADLWSYDVQLQEVDASGAVLKEHTTSPRAMSRAAEGCADHVAPATVMNSGYDYLLNPLPIIAIACTHRISSKPGIANALWSALWSDRKGQKHRRVTHFTALTVRGGKNP
jgi:hypothetical protein